MDSEEISLWDIDMMTHSAEELPRTVPDSEGQLEEVLARRIELLESGLLLIGRQLGTPSGPLDLLCVEGDGTVVVVELKKDRLPRVAVAQAIDYASQISTMPREEFKKFVQDGARKGVEGYPAIDDLDDFMQKWCADFDPESLNGRQKILLAGCRLDEQTEKMISWLSANGVDINAYELPFFKLGEKTILARRIIISSSEIERVRIEREKPRIYSRPVEELLGMADENGQKEQVNLLREFFQSKFSERLTRSTFSFSLNWDRKLGDGSRHNDIFCGIMCNKPYIYLYRDRCEKLTDKSLSMIEEGLKVSDRSSEDTLYLRQGTIEETKMLVDKLRTYFG